MITVLGILTGAGALACSSDGESNEGAPSGGDAGKTESEGGGGGEIGCGSSGTPNEPLMAAEDAPPIVFVHGFAGSAQQYQSQAIRFVANGYPPDHIYD
jgi:pimeloyl-ACP methyl ester carboxylesterase